MTQLEGNKYQEKVTLIDLDDETTKFYLTISIDTQQEEIVDYFNQLTGGEQAPGEDDSTGEIPQIPEKIESFIDQEIFEASSGNGSEEAPLVLLVKEQATMTDLESLVDAFTKEYTVTITRVTQSTKPVTFFDLLKQIFGSFTKNEESVTIEYLMTLTNETETIYLNLRVEEENEDIINYLDQFVAGNEVPGEDDSTGGEQAPGEDDSTGGEQAPGEDDSTGGEQAPGEDDSTGGEQAPGEDDSTGGEQAPGEDDSTGGEQAPGEDDSTGGEQAPGEDDSTGGEQAPGEDDSTGGEQAPGEDDSTGGEQAPGEDDSTGDNGLGDILEEKPSTGIQLSISLGIAMIGTIMTGIILLFKKRKN